jgi:DNA polymerase-3 subunit beta
MKAHIDKVSLVQVLQRVQSTTEKKTHMPILSNVLINAIHEQQMMEFTATDLELSIWTQLKAKIEEPGSVTVSAKKLLEIVRELPQEVVEFETHFGNRLTIRTGRSRFELATIPADDFPFVHFFEEIARMPFDREALRKALARTLYSIPSDEDPFSVAGLYWHHLGPEAFRFVASDGHRLVYSEVPESAFQGLDLGNGVIIPRKGVQEILKLLEKEGDASLTIHENSLLLGIPDALLSVQLLDAEFPEYQLIIPDERPSSFRAEKDPFVQALKRAAVVSDQKWRHVRFQVKQGVLELDSGNPETGQASDAVDIEYEGEDFTVSFNIRYVIDAIQAVESSQVRFEWVDQFHGGVFVGADDPTYLGLIMPMVV